MELLVMITDRANWQRGDVVSVLEDGSDWGRETPNHEFWRVIRSPILPSHAEALCSGDSTESAQRHREWTVDLDQLPPLIDAFITDVPRDVVMAASGRKE